MLVGEPGLGHELSEAWLESPDPVPVGGRLYYLELEGARPPIVPATARRGGAPRRSSDVTVAGTEGEFRVAIFLSEATAQRASLHLRRRGGHAAALALINRVVRRRVAGAGQGGRFMALGRIASRGMAMAAVPRGLALPRTPGRAGAFGIARLASTQGRGRGLIGVIRLALARTLPERSQAFLAAAAEDADGVTLRLTIRGGRIGTSTSGSPPADLQIMAGHQRA